MALLLEGTVILLGMLAVGLYLPLFLTRVLSKQLFSKKELFLCGFVTSILFVIVMIVANKFGLMQVNADGLNAVAIITLLLVGLFRKKELYQLVPIVVTVLVILKITNFSLFFLLFDPFLNMIKSDEGKMFAEFGFQFFLTGMGILIVLRVKKYFEQKKILSHFNYRTNFPIRYTAVAIGIFVFFSGIDILINARKMQLVVSEDILKLDQFNIIPLIVMGMLILFLLIMTNYTKNQRNVDLLQEKILLQSQLEEYVILLEEKQREIRKFKHDYQNILLGLTGYTEANDIEGLKSYLSEKVVPQSKIVSGGYYFQDLEKIKIVELKGITLAKLSQAQEKGCTVQLEVVEQVRHLGMDIVDVCRCVGILLDNAIEASLESAEKKLTMALITSENNVQLVIKNSTITELPSLHLFFEEGFSTKGNDRGLGLSNVKEIVKRYDMSTLETTIEHEEVIQCLKIGKE